MPATMGDPTSPAKRPARVHPSGKLVFRSNTRAPRSDDLPLFEPGDTGVEWEQLVPRDFDGDIEIEVGCGKGSFLLAAAERNADRRFVGVEAGPAYAGYCADRIARAGLDNAVLIADDARLFLRDSVPEASIARLHVYHPDPWPKRRHRKRRLFAAEFPELVARALRPNGQLLVSTDNTRYFGEILVALGKRRELRRSSELENDYGDEIAGVAFGPTNFAEKYIAEERQRHRAVYVRQDASNQVARDVASRGNE